MGLNLFTVETWSYKKGSPVYDNVFKTYFFIVGSPILSKCSIMSGFEGAVHACLTEP